MSSSWDAIFFSFKTDRQNKWDRTLFGQRVESSPVFFNFLRISLGAFFPVSNEIIGLMICVIWSDQRFFLVQNYYDELVR